MVVPQAGGQKKKEGKNERKNQPSVSMNHRTSRLIQKYHTQVLRVHKRQPSRSRGSFAIQGPYCYFLFFFFFSKLFLYSILYLFLAVQFFLAIMQPSANALLSLTCVCLKLLSYIYITLTQELQPSYSVLFLQQINRYIHTHYICPMQCHIGVTVTVYPLAAACRAVQFDETPHLGESLRQFRFRG